LTDSPCLSFGMIHLLQLLHSSVNNTADVKPFLIYGENRADGNALEEEIIFTNND